MNYTTAQYTSVPLNQSPSERNNNLKFDPSTGLLFYISQQDVCLVDYFDFLKKSHVNQVSEKNDHQNSIRNTKSKEFEKDALNFFNLSVNSIDLILPPEQNQTTMLVCAQGSGIHLWEVSKNAFENTKEIKYVLTIDVTKYADPKRGQTNIFALSAGSFNESKRSSAIVGLSNGEIFILRSTQAPTPVFTFEKSIISLTHEKNAICAITSNPIPNDQESEVAFATGDSCGNVCFWNKECKEIGQYKYPLEERLNEVATRVKKGEEFKKFVKPPFVSSIAMKKNRIAVGYSNGEIIIFQNTQKVATIAGHIRTVTGLVWHPKKEFLISVSKDTMAYVWDFNNSSPELANSLKYPDCLLTGATIIDDKLILSIYGEKEGLLQSLPDVLFPPKKTK